MAHRGAGAPPPRRSGGSSSGPIYHLAETVTKSDGSPLRKIVKALKLRPGTKNQPILTLDDFQKMEDGYSINLHVFNLRGTKDNIVVCPKTATDPRPCPICEVLNKDPSWYVVLSAIDRQKYEFDRKNKKTNQMEKVVYTDLRRVVLVTQTWLQRMDTNSDRSQGWRGSLFEVSRSEPSKTMENGREVLNFKDSPRIGDVWYFTEKYDEEKLKSEFEKRAAAYGLPVEKFVQPFDYETLLKPKSWDQLEQIAADIRNDGSAVKPQDGDVNNAVSSAASSGGPESPIDY